MMAYADAPNTRRTHSVALVAGVHLLLGYALVTGLAERFRTADDAPRTTLVDIRDQPPPPPLPEPRPVEEPAARAADLPVNVPQPIVPTPAPVPRIEVTRDIAPFTLPPVPARQGADPGPAGDPPAAIDAISRAASAQGDPARWISTADYPVRALRDGREGTSVVRWQIGLTGRVENCTVTRSSGHADLDRAACAALTRRGRYDPARDANGDPVVSSASRNVVWRLPAD